MSPPNPSPMDRHILDLLDRIERRHLEQIQALESRVRVLEVRNAELEAKFLSLETGVDILSASLDSFLAPPVVPPG